jgi:hypothetical protein
VTNLQIVNRALAMLGQGDASSMADTGINPLRAITAYPICRDEMISMIDWPSCTRRALMKNMADQAVPWTLSHAYEIGDRVTNDTLKTYQCITAGISAAVGGPTGTTSDITDGTVHWTYVEASTALNNWCHHGSTLYTVGDLVTSGVGNVYACITTGTTAAATPPTTTSADITDGTAHWAYYGTPPHNRTVYAYQYIMPADCLRIIKIPNLAAVRESDQGVQYLREDNWIYTDQDDSPLRYVRQEDDPTRWGVLLQGAVAARIAVEIALAVTGQVTVLKTMFELLGTILRTAKMAALHEGAEGTPEVDRWEDA